jgi:hypothetical protein
MKVLSFSADSASRDTPATTASDGRGTEKKQTRYMIRAEILSTKRIIDESFDSMSARALFKVSYSPYLRVLAEWQA